MIWCAIPIAVLVTCCVAVLLIPETTSATKSIRFDADIEDVWDIYTTPEDQMHWREDVGAVHKRRQLHHWHIHRDSDDHRSDSTCHAISLL